ncbi:MULTISPECIES: hypothetical protein [Bacillus]|uniref:hypothetical protein n=1 Tax=Bacillus TaxID=1386 RepID=UPI000BF4615B|nr:hypothetical protein [Bacillus wiedmannii]PFZ87310.1 hypothetical protein COL83_25985 [Bacillus wiedmannii]
MDKQYQFDVTFFLNNGEKFTGNITVTKKKADYMNELEDLLFRERVLTFTQLGVVVQTKYITHFLIEEVEEDKKDT